MTIEAMQPLVAVDWERVTHMRVTLEKPWKGGGLRWRQGTTEPRQNLSFDAHSRGKSGPRFWPGAPIMYPDDAPAIAGDPARDSFIMPANISARVTSRRGEMVPDVRQHAAFIAFGYFMAPLTDDDGIVGFTQSNERPRVASFWHGYEFPVMPDPTKYSLLRIGPPEMPHVALRPLTSSMLPIKVDGEEVVIRPHMFWQFDDPTMFDPLPPEAMRVADARAKAKAPAALEGLTADELEEIRAFVKARKSRGVH
jgi:hypothetical protein